MPVPQLVYPAGANGPRLKPLESLPCFMGLKAHAPSVSEYSVQEML